MSITIPCKPNFSWTENRNGVVKLSAIHLWTSQVYQNQKVIYIDCINRRGDVLRGGICVDQEAFNTFIQQYMKEELGVIIDPFPGPTNKIEEQNEHEN